MEGGLVSDLDGDKGARRLCGWVGAERGLLHFFLIWGEGDGGVTGNSWVARVAFGKPWPLSQHE